MHELLFSPIPLEQLKTEISDSIKREIENLISQVQPATNTDYLDRKEAARLLGISLPTLNQWTKTGTVQGYRIASRVRYKRAELETSFSRIKTQRRAA